MYRRSPRLAGLWASSPMSNALSIPNEHDQLMIDSLCCPHLGGKGGHPRRTLHTTASHISAFRATEPFFGLRETQSFCMSGHQRCQWIGVSTHISFGTGFFQPSRQKARQSVSVKTPLNQNSAFAGVLQVGENSWSPSQPQHPVALFTY